MLPLLPFTNHDQHNMSQESLVYLAPSRLREQRNTTSLNLRDRMSRVQSF